MGHSLGHFAAHIYVQMYSPGPQSQSQSFFPTPRWPPAVECCTFDRRGDRAPSVCVAIVVAPLTSRYVTWCPCWCGVPCRCSCVVCAYGRCCRRRRCRCRGGKEETKRIRRGCSITLRWTTLATPDQLPNWVKWWLPAQLGADHHHGTFIKIWENEKSFLISWDSMYYKNEPNKCEENSEKYYTW